MDIDVVANDRDFNADVLTIHNLTQPGIGAVAINGDQTIEYTPSGSVGYSTSFTYQVTDGSGPSNFATVTVTVIDPNMIDTDGDGLSDGLETSVGLDPYDSMDTVADADGDGVDNYAEYLAGTDPLVNESGLSAAIMAVSPLAYWKTDETSGTSLADSSGNGHTGTYNGSHALNQTSVLDSGSAAGFSGGYGYVGHNNALNLNGDYTIEGLARWDSDNYALIFDKALSVSPYTGTTVSLHSSGKVRLREDNDTKLYSTTAAMHDGAWRHFAFVRRGNDLEIWINGELDATASVAGPTKSTTRPLYIGGYSYAPSSPDGAIDDWAVHTQALTPAQIKAHVFSLGDKDLDNVPTGFELAYGHDPVDANDATADYDGDGATLYDEYVAATDPMLHPNGYQGAVLADSPAGFWRMEDVTNTADDTSANGFDGTFVDSVTYSQTPAIQEGNSVLFSNGYVAVPHDAALNLTGDFTIEAWLSWTGTAAKNAIRKRDDNLWGYRLSANMNESGTAAGRILFATHNGGFNGHELSPPDSGLNDGQWRHFAGVRRGTQLEIWIDGKLAATKTESSLSDMSNSTLQLALGRFEGFIDEAAVYDTALTAGDIRQRFVQGQEPPPVVRTQTRELPQNLDRWVEPGTLIALHDAADGRAVELYRLEEGGTWRRLEAVNSTLLAQATLRARRDAQGVSVYFQQGDSRFYRRVPNGLAQGLVAVSGGLNEVWSYTYDAVSNITQLTKPGGSEVFTYDALDRLNTYTLPGDATVTYTYDAVGNRTSETQSGVTQTHVYGTTDNRLLSQTGAAVGHDNAGNIISDQSGSRTFAYNHRNRLAGVVDNAVTVGTYTYNALGQRARKVAGASDTDYVYDLNGQLIGEYANGTLIREYIYMDGVPFAQVDSSQLIYLHADHLGTPRVGTDANATIVWRWDSDPFGAAAPDEDPDGDMTTVTVNLRLPGQYADMESGHYYNYFRTYDPTIGRYTQSDPIGLQGGLNTYAYVGGNPLTNSDPEGLFLVPQALRGVGQLSYYGATAVGAGELGAYLGTMVALAMLDDAARDAIEDALNDQEQADECEEDDARCEKAKAEARRRYAKLVNKRIPQYTSGGTRGSDPTHYASVKQLQDGLKDAIRRVKLYCIPPPFELPEWERVANLHIPKLH